MKFNQKVFIFRLRKLLEQNNITQKELSLRIGVRDVTVSRYFSGQRIPRTDVIVSIANYFKVSTDYLLGISDIKNPNDEILENKYEEDIELWLSKTDGYKELSQEDREIISSIAKKLLEKHRRNENL